MKLSDLKDYKVISQPKTLSDLNGNYSVVQPTTPTPAPQQSLSDKIWSGLSSIGKTYSELPGKIGADIQSGAQDIQQGNLLKGVVKSGTRVAGDVAGAVYAPIGAGIGATGIGKLTDAIGQGIADSKLGNAITNIPAVQDFAMKHPNAAEDFGRVLNLILAKGDRGTIEPSTAISRTGTQVQAGIDTAKSIPGAVSDTINSLRPTAESIAAERQAKLNSGFAEQNTRLKTANNSFNKNTIVRTDAEGNHTVITPIDTFAKYNIAPVIDKGGIQMGDYKTGTGELGKIKDAVTTLDSQIDTKLENTGQTVGVDELKQQAIDAVNNNSEFRQSGTVAQNVKKIEARFEDYKNSYGDTIDIAELNNIRKTANKDWNPDTQDTSRIIGDVARARVYDATPNQEIKGLLQQEGELLSARKYAETINGTKVTGGRLGNLALRTTGAVIGSTLPHVPILGPLAGAVGGEYAARALQQTQFRSAWTELKAFLQSNSAEVNQSANSTPNTANIPIDTTKGGSMSSPKAEGAIPKTTTSSNGSKILQTITSKVKDYIDNPRIGMSTEDVSSGASKLGQKIVAEGEQKPTIQLKRDVTVTTLSGEKVVIPADEVLKAYESGGKALLKDGREYIISKNQYENIKGNSVSNEAKPFAPELAGTEESIYGAGAKGKVVAGEYKVAKDTKFSQYQLPGGKNYKEIIIQAPVKNAPLSKVDNLEMQKLTMKSDRTPAETARLKELGGRADIASPQFESSHWPDIKNPISHLRLNERTYQGKPVTFMEELQSDWAREARKNPVTEDAIKNIRDTNDFTREQAIEALKNDTPQHPLLKNWQELSVKRALKEAVNNKSEYFAWTTGEQQAARYNLSKEVKEIDWSKAKTGTSFDGQSIVRVHPVSGEPLNYIVNDKGIVTSGKNGVGKPLSEVIGKGVAEKILAEPKGNLAGEGLNIGGEWAKNLYDRQVKNIVEDVTGGKVENMDMGLPVEKNKNNFQLKTKNFADVRPLKTTDLKVGVEVLDGSSSYIITDIIGGGKFKAVPKDSVLENVGDFDKRKAKDIRKLPDGNYYSNGLSETFDISTKKSVQMGLKITPQIRAKIKGEAIKLNGR